MYPNDNGNQFPYGGGYNGGGNSRGGYQNNGSGYQNNRGGYQNNGGGYQNNRGGYQNNRGGYEWKDLVAMPPVPVNDRKQFVVVKSLMINKQTGEQRKLIKVQEQYLNRQGQWVWSQKLISLPEQIVPTIIKAMQTAFETQGSALNYPSVTQNAAPMSAPVQGIPLTASSNNAPPANPVPTHVERPAAMANTMQMFSNNPNPGAGDPF